MTGKWGLFLGVMLSLAAIANPGAARAADVVRFASVGGTTDAGIYIGEEYGIFKAAGIALKYQRLENAAALIAALATEQIDVGGISLTPGLFAAQSQGVNLRIVGDKESILADFAATQFVVQPDLATGSEAEILHRVKGKTVAVSGRTSVSYFLLSRLLGKYGMALDDVHVVELGYPSMLPAFINHAIDAAIELEPFLSQAEDKAGVKPVSDLVEIVPAVGASIVPMVYSEKFAENRKLADSFMLAYLKSVRLYLDAFKKGIDKDRVIDVIARHTNFDPQTIRDGNPVGFAPDQIVNKDFLDEDQHFFVEQHFIPALADLDTLVDPSFAQAAVKVLGTYK